MKLLSKEPTPEMLSIISNEKEVFHSAESLYAALYDAAPEADVQAEIAKRDARIAELEQSIDNELVVSHLGVFNPGDDPKAALNKLQCYSEGVGGFFARYQLHEQAAEIARLKEALLRITSVPADTVTTAYDMRRIAIAAIKECENATN